MSSNDSVPVEVVFVPLPIIGAANSAATDGAGATSASLLNDPRPIAPAEPDAADCCGEGCVRCVYDNYDAAVERYEVALERWNVRHP